MTNYEHDSQWWQVEPPDYEYEPDDDQQPGAIEDEYEARTQRFTFEQLSSFEYLDGAKSHSLFSNVRITDKEGELSFSVPKRHIDSGNLGKWELEVYGKQRWFKEHDDYGQIRFLANGTALWIPHLYPFEETTTDGIPLIPDRERCELVVTMKSMQTFEPDDSPEVVIKTPYGNAFADSSQNIEESYGADRNYYRQFAMQDKPLISQLVSYDDRWHNLAAYLNDPTTQETYELYHQMMLGRVPIPEAYLRSKEPNDWTERQSSDFQGNAFGSIWVPIDELRKGIETDISFPNLITSTDTI